VLTHGDFNPFNLFPKGVIDFEDHFFGPEGYDIVTSIIHATWFPRSGDFEKSRAYHLDHKQAKEVLRVASTVFDRDLEQTFGPLVFLRSSWHVAGMQQWPKLQHWRYRRFEQLLKLFLTDQLTLENYWKFDESF